MADGKMVLCGLSVPGDLRPMPMWSMSQMCVFSVLACMRARPLTADACPPSTCIHHRIQLTDAASHVQGAAHTVLPVPGAPTSVTLLTPRFALFRDFCTPDWTAGEVGCWTCAVTPAAPTWSAPGIVPISAAAPQSKKLRRVPSVRCPLCAMHVHAHTIRTCV